MRAHGSAGLRTTTRGEKIGEQRGWRVHAHTACSPVISRRARKLSTPSTPSFRNRISKREISNAYSNEMDHSRITSFNVYFPSFFPPLSIRMTRILDEYVTNTRTLVNFYAKQTNFDVSRSSNIVDCRQSLRTIDRRVIVD